MTFKHHDSINKSQRYQAIVACWIDLLLDGFVGMRTRATVAN